MVEKVPKIVKSCGERLNCRSKKRQNTKRKEKIGSCRSKYSNRTFFFVDIPDFGVVGSLRVCCAGLETTLRKSSAIERKITATWLCALGRFALRRFPGDSFRRNSSNSILLAELWLVSFVDFVVAEDLQTGRPDLWGVCLVRVKF